MAILSANDPGFRILIGLREDWRPRAPVMLPELREKYEAAIREEAKILPLSRFDRRSRFRRPPAESAPCPPWSPPVPDPLPYMAPEPPRPREPTCPDPDPVALSRDPGDWRDPERERAPEEVSDALAEGKVTRDSLSAALRDALAEGGVKVR